MIAKKVLCGITYAVLTASLLGGITYQTIQEKKAQDEKRRIELQEETKIYNRNLEYKILLLFPEFEKTTYWYESDSQFADSMYHAYQTNPGAAASYYEFLMIAARERGLIQ